jgi:hypothetical protein
MKRLALLGIFLLVSGCQQATSSSYLQAVQLLDAETQELERAYIWNNYVKAAFLPDGFYPSEADNIRGVVPKTKEEAAEEVQKAVDYLTKQRARVERARQAREAADR